MNIIYEYDRYCCDVDSLKDTLDKYGVAIIPNVLDEDECTQMKKDMWRTLGTLTEKFNAPIDRKDQSSWRSFYDLFPLHSMLVQHHSIGHSSLAWNVRRNPKVHVPFAKLWDDDDLLTSFDGVSIHFPPEITNKGWLTDKNVSGLGKLHTDQTYHENDFKCIQSWVTAYDVDDGDATLTFLESSHKLHGKFNRKFDITAIQKPNDNWYQLKDPEELKYYTDRCERRSIKCPAGSMVFWDSRTIHSGQEAIRGREKPKMRCVVYVCMQPRSFCDEKNLIKKQNAFNEMRTTNHWPCNIKMFPKMPRTYGKEIGEISKLPKPNLTDDELRLAGF